MGTNLIQGIKLDLPAERTLYLNPQTFRKMKGLRMHIFHNVDLSTSIRYLSDNLRFIEWPGYQFDTVPFSHGRKCLVILDMLNNCIQQLGEISQNFKKLKIVNLSGSEFLTEIPDLSTAPNRVEI
ncbi:hypothetical protein FEM48_Zijuj05G0187800 [Ziziphus jujuba var. spinosa]|uniref:Uncharacterized protein n=1 Tax=Ziziphus jujuba var. spinosa TaxID=714518 RepID=A0A978VGI6_ZIZJJ|nr:hypothetical protein FEM48_Zijuj05G0187800 [Ziziphus jujuba var. spinosa]